MAFWTFPCAQRCWSGKLSATAASVRHTLLLLVFTKTWDTLLSGFAWPALIGLPARPPWSVPAGADLSCGQAAEYFYAVVVCATLLLVAAETCLPSGSLRDLLPASLGMLTGWAFKGHINACHQQVDSALTHELDTAAPADDIQEGVAIFDVAFAAVATAVAAVTVTLANHSHRQARIHHGSNVLRVSVLSGMRTLLASGLGLGVAASWDQAFDEVIGLDHYAAFLVEAPETGNRNTTLCGAGARGMRVEKLPSHLLLRLAFAVSINTLAALLENAVRRFHASRQVTPRRTAFAMSQPHPHSRTAAASLSMSTRRRT